MKENSARQAGEGEAFALQLFAEAEPEQTAEPTKETADTPQPTQESLLLKEEAAAAPESYDFASVFGEQKLEEDLAGNFTELAKGGQFSQAEAEAWLRLGTDYAARAVEKSVTEAVKARDQEYIDLRKGWYDEAVRELGGDYDKRVTVAAEGIEVMECTIPGLRTALRETGADVRIEFVRLFEQVGELVREDTGKSGKSAAAAANTADLYFRNSK